ncbi:MAG: SPL family radical SAM protein, partial [Sphaerochaetaceae bacterium]
MNHPLFVSLPLHEQCYLKELDERYHFSFQQQRQLIESASDLAMWQLGPLRNWIDEESVSTIQ